MSRICPVPPNRKATRLRNTDVEVLYCTTFRLVGALSSLVPGLEVQRILSNFL
jgi:hypothetical protein